MSSSPLAGYDRDQLLAMLDELLAEEAAGWDARRDAAEQAVRDYQSPERLARNPLARGTTTTARAEHVRALVDTSADDAFGTSHADAGLREVLVAGYLVASAPHEALAYDLHLSRSTYFRRLASALRRVAAHMADAQAASASVSADRERTPSLS